MIAITTMNKIPEYCYDCPCHDGNNGKCKAANRYSSDDRPNWCPISYAIPVEFLERRREGLIFAAMTGSQVYGNNTIELCNAINMVLDMWQKEQEAQDGKV